MLADIDAGSHTPTLVGKVLAWKKSKPQEGNFLSKHFNFKTRS
jgi:phosphomevalonate kinase